jgi:hypothetical protein
LRPYPELPHSLFPATDQSGLLSRQNYRSALIELTIR